MNFLICIFIDQKVQVIAVRIVIPKYVAGYNGKHLVKCFLGTIQVLRHQRGGWVGWPNDDV